MFFYVSKIVWFFASPTNFLVVLTVLAALLLFTRWKRLGRAAAVLAALGLLAIGFGPVGKLVVRPLEDRFPQATAAGRQVDGIVVLGGAIGFGRGQVAFNEATARMTAGIEIAKRHPGARLVFTGGDGSLFEGDGRAEADAAEALFRLAGIEDERLVLERRSRNTRENALFTRELDRRRSPASAGSSSPPRSTCRAPSAASAPSASTSRRIRSITARRATPATCGPSGTCSTACSSPTSP